MPSPKTSLILNRPVSDHALVGEEQDSSGGQGSSKLSRKRWVLQTWLFAASLQLPRFFGAVTINFVSFLLPALYGTLSKYWVSTIDSSVVATVDAYVYIGVVAEVINEGLPRAAWLVIGDNASRSMPSRLGLSQTLIAFQALLGLIVSLVILGAASRFAGVFVPAEIRKVSLTYVRLGAFSTFSGVLEYATTNVTRALDYPNVPLVISLSRFLLNIVLDLLLISPFHIGNYTPTVNTQGAIKLACDMAAAFVGLLYFLYIVVKLRKKHKIDTVSRPSVAAFLVLLRPGLKTFAESAIRNTLYLWLVANIVSMGTDYATAWGVFNTIRWGLVMVPVQTLEASSLTFIGHRWGQFRHLTNQNVRPKATRHQLKYVATPALISCLIALAIEIPLCILLSTVGAKPYAHWISSSDAVAAITAHMWQTIDWCYVFYALSTQLATILLATMPRWYLYQSLASNILYVLPWAIVCQVHKLNADNAWTYHSLVFGGSLVFSFFDVLVVVGLWGWKLHKGTMRVGKVKNVN